MARITLNQVAQQSLIPERLGICREDVTTLARYVNEAINRLIFFGGETGFSGGWMRVVFNVDPNNPYVVCQREIVRLVNADVCKWPVRISNEWPEFLESGPGLQTAVCGCPTDCCLCGSLGIYDRGTVPSAVDMTATNKLLRVYLTNAADKGRRVLISGVKDQNGMSVFSQDGLNPVNGFYLILDQPFTTSTFKVTSFAAISKDATFGDVLLKEVDATTGVEKQLSRYAPDELNPSYRKYLIKNLPVPQSPATTIPVTALAKLEFIPAVRGTDFLLIGNIPALTEECESIRYGGIDNPQSQAMSVLKHKQAIKLLNAELRHTQGEQNPAITLTLDGLEGLELQQIGSMI